ncbi:MAG: exosome complex protein Rrp42 [Candidatus Bathyarchaeota archaeon]|nr:MAG: exosome complex protein Rrp42 [Candidatus Bathyarchaeota archaeon]
MSENLGMVSKITQKRISELLKQDKRIDGRGLNDYRELKVEAGLIERAAGSALVTLGKTKVMVGVKIETGTPYPDTPDNGVLTVNVELVPLASPKFEPGPPKEDAIELARVVDRGIRESQALDLKKLCIVSGKKVFIIFVDIYALDFDGNLFDASTLASIAALKNAKMKDYVIKKDGELEYKANDISLPLQNYPVAISTAKIDDKLVVDPSLGEEIAADAAITVAIGKKGNICAIQKRKVGTFSVDEIIQIINLSKQKAKEIGAMFLKG